MNIQDFEKLDSNIKLKLLLENSDIILGFNRDEIVDGIISLNDNDKMTILHNLNFLKKYNIYKNVKVLMICVKLSDEKKRELLLEKEFVKKELEFEDNYILTIIDYFKSEEIRLEMTDFYEFKNYQRAGVIKKFSDESKIAILLENKYNFDKYDMEIIMSRLSIISLIGFYREHKEFFVKNDITLYSVIGMQEKKVQLETVSKLEDLGLTCKEKKGILAILDEETKRELDISSFPPEYITAIEMRISHEIGDSYGKIVIDLTEDLEKYRDLDEVIYINPINLSSEEKTRLLKLCQMCQDMNIYDNMGLSSTVEEYKNAENWIDSVLQGINPEWTDIEKVAYIDNVVGQEITYCPYFDTEIYNSREIQNMWNVVNKKTGICLGISELEEYMLSKIGIESEVVISESKRHGFLKLKNIELPRLDGSIVKGDTILDPTWNLMAHRYGGEPEKFCRSYEEMRKHDIIEADGTDTESHKNDEALVSATLSLDEKSLREVFTSIGVADKDGIFPIKKFFDKSKIIDDFNLPTEESIKTQFKLLEDYYPEFATCQNETMKMLSMILLYGENLKFNRCVVNRVYAKRDDKKEPVVYVYADLPEVGKKFYFADKETKSFVELQEKEFEEKFERYEKDMEKQAGHRPWEDIEVTENQEDLSQSSEQVIVPKGEGR